MNQPSALPAEIAERRYDGGGSMTDAEMMQADKAGHYRTIDCLKEAEKLIADDCWLFELFETENSVSLEASSVLARCMRSLPATGPVDQISIDAIITALHQFRAIAKAAAFDEAVRDWEEA